MQSLEADGALTGVMDDRGKVCGGPLCHRRHAELHACAASSWMQSRWAGCGRAMARSTVHNVGAMLIGAAAGQAGIKRACYQTPMFRGRGPLQPGPPPLPRHPLSPHPTPPHPAGW